MSKKGTTYTKDMKKEIIIVTGILISIVILIYYCQKYLDYVTENVSNLLKDIRNQTIPLSEGDSIQIQETILQITNLRDEWNVYEKKLSLYIEHSELEKIDTCLIRMKSYLETYQYKETIPEIDECIFWFQHIDQKQKLNLSNLF